MYWNFQKFLLEKYSSFFIYWQLSIFIFIIAVITSLYNCTNLLKFLVFIIINILILFYLLGSNLIAYNTHTKKVLSSSTCIKDSYNLFDIITIIIIVGFALVIFLLNLNDSPDSSILGFKIDLENKIIIISLAVLSLMVTYIFGYLLTEIPKLYSSLSKVAKKNNYITDPSNNTTLIGWLVLLIIILVWFSLSNMFTELSTISKYTIKGLVCIGLLFLYFSYLISYNLSYLQKNYYEILNKK